MPESPQAALHGLILAAGASRRMGRLKQTIRHRGESLVRQAVTAATAVTGLPVTVVTGAGAEQVELALRGSGARMIRNEEWPRGIGCSLALGIRALRDTAGAVLVLGCDQPDVTAADLERLGDAWRVAPGRPAAARYAGVLGIPAIFPRAWFDQLASLDGDRGARDLLRRGGADVTAVEMPNAARDLDEPKDLETCIRKQSGPGGRA